MIRLRAWLMAARASFEGLKLAISAVQALRFAFTQARRLAKDLDGVGPRRAAACVAVCAGFSTEKLEEIAASEAGGFGPLLGLQAAALDRAKVQAEKAWIEARARHGARRR